LPRRRSGRAARRRCSVRVAIAQPPPPSGCCARRGSALGCTGRTGARVRGLARGERRVVPVAGPDASSAGASRRGAPNSHLQTDAGRCPIHPYVLRMPTANTGQKRPEVSARRGGVLGGSAGQWPSMELAGRARAQGARSARAFQPIRLARPPGNQSAPRGDMAAHTPLHNRLGMKASHHHKVLAWRRRARGHEWPESSARARRGSTAARRPASRQGDTTAHPNAVGAKQSRAQGGKKGVRWLRWCSLRGGGGVVAGSVERCTKAG
jgi:hypothetical protein